MCNARAIVLRCVHGEVSHAAAGSEREQPQLVSGCVAVCVCSSLLFFLFFRGTFEFGVETELRLCGARLGRPLISSRDLGDGNRTRNFYSIRVLREPLLWGDDSGNYNRKSVMKIVRNPVLKRAACCRLFPPTGLSQTPWNSNPIPRGGHFKTGSLFQW